MVKYIDGIETRLLKYEDIAALAMKEGVHNDRVSVGIWAKQHGYTKTRKQKKKKVFIGYYKDYDCDNK